MQSLGERFGRRWIVMDFLGDAGWPIGTPPVVCFWALYRGVACMEDDSRFAGWHLIYANSSSGMASRSWPPAYDRAGWFRCLAHDRLIEGQCPAYQRRLQPNGSQ
jgi:hypothetical protein